jgi:hypothetical protein
VLPYLDRVQREAARVGVGDTQKRLARERPFDAAERRSGERLRAKRDRPITEDRERGVEVVKMRIDELERMHLGLEERRDVGRCPLVGAEARTEKRAVTVREDDKVPPLERRLDVVQDAEAVLSERPPTRGLLHAAFREARPRQEGKVLASTRDEESVVFHEDRVVRPVHEGDRLDLCTDTVEKMRERAMLPRGAPRLNRTDAHVRVDLPGNLKSARTTTPSRRRAATAQAAARRAHEELRNGGARPGLHAPRSEQHAGRRHPCLRGVT